MDGKAIRPGRCDDARALLPEYIEGELGAADRDRVAGHLELCGLCRDDAERTRRALRALTAAPPAQSPGDLYFGFARKLEASQRRDLAVGRRLRFAGAAACLLVVVGAGAATFWINAKAPSAPVAPVPLAAANRIPAETKLPVPPPQQERRSASVTARTDPAANPDPFEAQPDSTVRNLRRVVKTASRPRQTREETDFLSVRPKRGLSVAQRLAAKSTAVNARGDGRPGPWDRATAAPAQEDERLNPLTPFETRVSGFIPERDEQIQVGDATTVIKTSYKTDAEGRRTSVDVNIGTTQTP